MILTLMRDVLNGFEFEAAQFTMELVISSLLKDLACVYIKGCQSKLKFYGNPLGGFLFVIDNRVTNHCGICRFMNRVSDFNIHTLL